MSIPISAATHPKQWIELAGALHVHSRYSDGTGSVPEILAAARAAGLDHVILSDHDSLSAQRENWQGTHDGVTLVVGVEITPWRQGHLLALGVTHCEGYAVESNKCALDQIHSQGGFALAAHPMGKHKPTLGIRHERWQNWMHPAVRGIEIWSYMHDWVDEIEWWRLPAAYEFWKHPERRVRGPQKELLRLWDWFGRGRRLSGVAGLDCHAYILPLVRRKLFDYEQMFRSIRNHIFVEAAVLKENPVRAITDSISEGRLFVAHDILADSTGARCEALLPGGAPIPMGAEVPFSKGTSMTLSLPREAEIRWIANGQCRLKEIAGELTTAPAEPGVYRFEAWIDGNPWLFTNPFYLR